MKDDWNIRVMKDRFGNYSFREVNYTPTGKIESWSSQPKAHVSLTHEGLKTDMVWFEEALDQPVLDEEELYAARDE